MLGFLLPIRFLSDRIASLGCTVFDLIISEISRLVAISSKLEAVALSICSSRADVPEYNHPAMVNWLLSVSQTTQAFAIRGISTSQEYCDRFARRSNRKSRMYLGERVVVVAGC